MFTNIFSASKGDCSYIGYLKSAEVFQIIDSKSVGIRLDDNNSAILRVKNLPQGIHKGAGYYGFVKFNGLKKVTLENGSTDTWFDLTNLDLW